MGVSRYRNALLRLEYAADDARALRDAWARQPAGKLYDRVMKLDLLTDGDATAEKVLAALERLRKKVEDRPDDTVVVFLAGHGDGDRKGRVLITSSTTSALPLPALA